MKQKPLTYYGMTVAQGARHVRDQLTLNQMVYAMSPKRGIYRGFAALHDTCDANMLLPHSSRLTNSQKQTDYYNAVMERLTEWLIEDYNITEINKRSRI